MTPPNRDREILDQIAAVLPYASQRVDVRNTIKIPDRISEVRSLWPRIHEAGDEDTIRELAEVVYSAIEHAHTDGDLEDAATEATEKLSKELEPLCDIPEKVRKVLQTIENASPHIGRPREVEDLVLALRDTLEIVDLVVQKANL